MLEKIIRQIAIGQKSTSLSIQGQTVNILAAEHTFLARAPGSAITA
jgi:hypothetical protein